MSKYSYSTPFHFFFVFSKVKKKWLNIFFFLAENCNTNQRKDVKQGKLEGSFYFQGYPVIFHNSICKIEEVSENYLSILQNFPHFYDFLLGSFRHHGFLESHIAIVVPV